MDIGEVGKGQFMGLDGNNVLNIGCDEQYIARYIVLLKMLGEFCIKILS